MHGTLDTLLRCLSRTTTLLPYPPLSKRLSICFLIIRNRDFDRKIFSNSFSKWLSKYNHPSFHVSR